MEEIMIFVNNNVQYAPWIIFGLLLLAGLNIPVSEDFMLFTSAILAAKNPDYMYQLFFGVFAGAYFSDIICFSLGKFFGPKLFKIKFFANMVSKEKMAKVHNYYERYGIITLIFGRFIPFGVRNALFLTAGIGQMNPVKFSLSDLLACTISCIAFFSLYYNYGESVIEVIKKGNLIIFGVAIVVVLIVIMKKRKSSKVAD